MEGAAVALLLTVTGNVVTAADRGTFLTFDDCATYAQAEAPAMVRLGAIGIGCAQKGTDNKTLIITVYGRALARPGKRRAR